MNNPTYTILAGPNGSGKSTFRQVMNIEAGKIIDADLYSKKIREIRPDLNQKQSDIKAAKIAINEIKDCLKNRLSFIQETTLSGHMKSNIDLAKLQGFNVNLIFIAIQNPELTIKNIAERVSQGGHHIPKEDVYRRFQKSYDNLIELSKRVDKLSIFDNSNKDYEPLLGVEKGKLLYINRDMPKWLNKTIIGVVENSKEFSSEKVYLLSDKHFTKNPFEVKKGSVLITGREELRKVDKLLRNEITR